MITMTFMAGCKYTSLPDTVQIRASSINRGEKVTRNVTPLLLSGKYSKRCSQGRRLRRRHFFHGTTGRSG